MQKENQLESVIGKIYKTKRAADPDYSASSLLQLIPGPSGLLRLWSEYVDERILA